MSPSSKIEVRSPEKLTNAVQKLLEKRTRSRNLKISVSGRKNNRSYYSIQSGTWGYYNKQEDKDHEDYIIPLYETKGEIFWLGTTITFTSNPNGMYVLDDIAIRIYKGERSTNKTILFRAEWSNIDGLDHGQPHWHFYSLHDHEIKQIDETSFTQETGQIVEFDPDKPQVPESKTLSKNLNKFHFAMSANWHLGKGHVIKFENEKQLKNWFAGCVEYIIQQISYSFS